MPDLLGNIFEEVCSTVQYWQPKKEYSREEDYRDDLIEFLRKQLNRPNIWQSIEYIIQKESGRGLADIGINRRVGIELKLNFKGKSKADRLKGQLDEELKDYAEGIIIVTCGKTDKDTIEYLKPFLMKLSQTTILGGKLVRLVDKSTSLSQKTQSENNPFNFKFYLFFILFIIFPNIGSLIPIVFEPV